MLKYILSFLTFACLPALLTAQHDFDSLYEASAEFRKSFETVQESFDLFGDEEVLAITITSDFKQLNRQKDTLEYQDALLEYAFNDSIVVHRDIGIKARGNFRRKFCSNPPIKLNFPKKTTKLEWLQNFDKMKMVGDCKEGTVYEQYLLSEYYVYKMFNMLTDQSFRVRLLYVTYQDSGRKNKNATDTRYAFLIEPHDALAERMDSEILDSGNFPYDVFKPEELNLIAVFQYMIGNTDWSIPGQHNIKILKPKSSDLFIRTAVPYDFDYCGIVNPPYAIPSDLLPIENIRERLFRGPCREFDSYTEILEKFRQKKNEIYALIEGSEYLEKSTQSYMISYLDSFYEIINSPQQASKEFSVNCK